MSPSTTATCSNSLYLRVCSALNQGEKNCVTHLVHHFVTISNEYAYPTQIMTTIVRTNDKEERMMTCKLVVTIIRKGKESRPDILQSNGITHVIHTFSNEKDLKFSFQCLRCFFLSIEKRSEKTMLTVGPGSRRDTFVPTHHECPPTPPQRATPDSCEPHRPSPSVDSPLRGGG